MMKGVHLSVGNVIKFSQRQDMTFFLCEKWAAISETIAPIHLYLIVDDVRLLWLLFVGKF